MTSPKSMIRRKAAKAVVVHSAHGSISKVRRRPARSAALLTAGAAIGMAIGFLLGRWRAPATATPPRTSTQAPAPDRPVAAPTMGVPA